jgi:type I restriction enzyme R subunit
MNEAETRAEHVDPALKAAGWGLDHGSRILREYPITPGRIEGHGHRGKPLTADYVLVHRNRKLAVIEAKAWEKPLAEGVGQAKNYADKMAVRFAYATNGQGIYGIDMETGAESELPSYPSPDELWTLTFAQENAWRDHFSAVPFEDKGGSHPARYYQDIAVERVMEAIAAETPRILLTLATGSGKTFFAFPVAWKLFHARWNLTREPTRRPRILFLADRNILANQAFNAFSAFPEDAMVRISPADIAKKGKVPKNGSLFFTIFQTFMSGTDAGGGACALLRRLPARLLRLHRRRRVPPRRRQRREQLARHPRLLRPGGAARHDGDAEAQGQRRYLRLLRRAGLHLLAHGRHQRRLPHSLQGEADLDHPRRVRLHARRPDYRGRSRGGPHL